MLPEVESVEVALRNRVAAVLPIGCDFEVAREHFTTLVLYPVPGSKNDIVTALPRLAKVLYALMPLEYIRIGEDAPMDVRALLRIWPTEVSLPFCERLEAEQLGLTHRIAEAAIAELSRDRAIFLINKDGVYIRAELPPLATPPCPPEQMAGKRVSEVMGEEAHEEITRQINISLSLERECGAFYQAVVGGETRTYAARIRPLGSGIAWVSVIRL
jgi:hypothetical protein